MNLLAIETATERLSLAVSVAGVVTERTLAAGQRHAELVLGEIDALFARAGLRIGDLDGIAYGAGPGSFTGPPHRLRRRSGPAAARALPVVGVSSPRRSRKPRRQRASSRASMRAWARCIMPHTKNGTTAYTK